MKINSVTTKISEQVPTIEKHDIIQFSRKKNGRKTGVMIAVIDEHNPDQVNIGFSFCSPRDTFDREWGKMIAINRAIAYSDKDSSEVIHKIPSWRMNDVSSFISRCRIYYKDKKLPAWIEE